jgi:hypothetical protein
MTALLKNDYAPAWAKRISPDEWRQRLPLEEPLRGAVAAVVSWDVFGNRPWKDRWTHIEDLVTDASLVTLDELREGLERVGYPPHQAAKRTKPTKEVAK